MSIYIICVYNFKIRTCMYMHSYHIILQIIKFGRTRILSEHKQDIYELSFFATIFEDRWIYRKVGPLVQNYI